MGPEVGQLEQCLSEFTGAKYAISCANGTDALHLVLRAKNIGPGDIVFVPSFTFAASAEAVKLVGATPYFVDVQEDTYNMDPSSLLSAIDYCKKNKLNAKCVMTVDLFGRPVDYNQINTIAQEHNLWVLADSAQGLGSEYDNKKSGCFADITTTSFFPAKPLGCYGDGGCIFTDDDELAQIIKSLRIHGKGTDKYDNIRIGTNSRLDTMQAAILLEKLKVFPAELGHRQKVAETYNKYLSDTVQTPVTSLTDNNLWIKSAWAQYTIVLPEFIERTKFMAELKQQGVPSMVYYIKPLHLQTAYKDCYSSSSMAVTEKLANRVISLPMDGYLELDKVECIAFKLTNLLESNIAII